MYNSTHTFSDPDQNGTGPSEYHPVKKRESTIQGTQIHYAMGSLTAAVLPIRRAGMVPGCLSPNPEREQKLPYGCV